MPIQGEGWEILFSRTGTQKRASDGKVRTIGHYQVYRNGVEAAGLTGMFAETRGPGDNSKAENGRRVEAKRYPLWTQAGEKYVTLGFVENESIGAKPKPGIELKDTGARKEILIHPGIGYLSSIGCINLCTNLPNAEEPISYAGSRRRVIAAIEDMKAWLNGRFPDANGKRIPDCWAVIDGEPN